MAKIQIIKKKNASVYKFIIYKNDDTIYVDKNEYISQKAALEAAKNYYNNQRNTLFPIKEKLKEKTKELKPSIKKLFITGGCYRLISAGVALTIGITSMFGIKKVLKDFTNLLPVTKETVDEIEHDMNSHIITANDCDFTNLHIILRSANKQTAAVGVAASDMLTKLGVSNEAINKDGDLSSKVSEVIVNKELNVVVINIESGYETFKSHNTIIMGDMSNKRKYSSDILASCIKASLNEYSLNPIIKSGKKADIWRKQTYIEKELTNSSLINNVSQLTIDLPATITDDRLIKNDAAAAIVEGIMRWTTLDISERYKNVYYTSQYGDNIITISEENNISINDIEKNSDIDMRKNARVGNTVLIGEIPKVATKEARVCNPYTTIDANMVEERYNTYVVKNGDTIANIANNYGVKIEDITVPSGNSNYIYIGDIVYIKSYNLYETHKKTDYTLKKQL